MAARQVQVAASVLFPSAEADTGDTAGRPLLLYFRANETGAFRRPILSLRGNGRRRFLVVRIVVLAFAEATKEVVQAVHLKEDYRRDEQCQKL